MPRGVTSEEDIVGTFMKYNYQATDFDQLKKILDEINDINPSNYVPIVDMINKMFCEICNLRHELDILTKNRYKP